jgi:hypothetical protein
VTQFGDLVLFNVVAGFTATSLQALSRGDDQANSWLSILLLDFRFYKLIRLAVSNL